MTGSHEVRGSSPLSSTNKTNRMADGACLRLFFCDSFGTGDVLAANDKEQAFLAAWFLSVVNGNSVVIEFDAIFQMVEIEIGLLGGHHREIIISVPML